VDLDSNEGLVTLNMCISHKDIEGIIFNEGKDNVLIALKSGGHIYLPFKGSKVLDSLISDIEDSGSIDITFDNKFNFLSNIEYKKLLENISNLENPRKYIVEHGWDLTVDPTTIIAIESKDYGLDILLNKGILYEVHTTKTIEQVKSEIAQNKKLAADFLYRLFEYRE